MLFSSVITTVIFYAFTLLLIIIKECFGQIADEKESKLTYVVQKWTSNGAVECCFIVILIGWNWKDPQSPIGEGSFLPG